MMQLKIKDKFDIETAKQLITHADQGDELAIEELFAWTLDINWPVAEFIYEYIKVNLLPFKKHILKVFYSKDQCWAFFMTYAFHGELTKDEKKSYLPEFEALLRVWEKDEDVLEELNWLIKEKCS